MTEMIGARIGWEHFAHGADVGVRGFGRSVSEAFEQAALALTAIVTDAEVAPVERVDVSCRQESIDLLLVDWLDAIIYEMAVRKVLFGRFAVSIAGSTLTAGMWGEAVDIARHAPACEPKGATLTALRVFHSADGGCSAACVIDV